MAPDNYKVSFCITCKGRLDHLKQTLPQNLKNNADYPNTEFVILNYDSPDDLENWLKENYKAEIDSGKIRYAKYSPAPHFKFSHAKNMAHRVATGDILCNLDADNTTVPGFATWLNKEFTKNKDICIRPHANTTLAKRILTHADQGGFSGRIALHRDHFERLHGYDEKYIGWGEEDGNLGRRAESAGLKPVGVPYSMLGQVIPHSHERRLEHLDPASQLASQEIMDGRKKRSLLTKCAGRVSRYVRPPDPPPANVDGKLGCGKVQINFDEEKTLEPIAAMPSPMQVPPESAVDRLGARLGYSR